MIRAREDRCFDRFRRAGDPRLLAKVFDRTAPELWKVASHLCRDRHAAEDAVQGTFLVAIEAQHDWDATRPLLPWLLGLLVNRVRETRRRQRAPETTRVASPVGERDPADLASGGEIGQVVQAAMQRIPEPFRDTLRQHLVHGLGPAEIAAATGVPAGTVRMRLHRGLDQLRRRLPVGIAGGLTAAVLTRESLAAMRQVVLAAVPGGAEVAVVGAGSGHFLATILGVTLMQKTTVSVLVAGLVLAGSWLMWQPRTETAPPGQITMATAPAVAAAAIGDGHHEAKAPAEADVQREAAAVPTTAKGRLHVVARTERSSRPVANLSLELLAGLEHAVHGPGPQTSSVKNPPQVYFGRTDADGTATFTLPPGFVTVGSSLIDSSARLLQAEIRPGQTAELSIDLPIQVDADVLVVDPAGNPVAGARVLGRSLGDVGVVVDRELGRTGPDGHWREQFVERSVPVRAVHDGFASSPPADVRREQGKVRLVLGADAATVAGTVRDLDGSVVANAQVVIQPRGKGHGGERPLALVADAQGRFACGYVPAGAFTVLAYDALGARSTRTARLDASAIAGQSAEVEVRFRPGAQIEVHLLGADGKPVQQQPIAAVLQPEPELWVHLAAMTGEATTDANGIAVLQPQLEGDYEVQAFLPTEVRKEKVRVHDGQRLQLEWRLGAAAGLEVQVVDAAGRPLPDWTVTLRPEAGPLRESCTDADGIARFGDLAVQAAMLQVRGAGSKLASLTAPAVFGKRMVLQVPAAAMPTCTLHGRVVAPEGLDLTAVVAECARLDPDGRAGEIQGDRVALTEDATFVFTRLPSGTYLLGFRRGQREMLGTMQRFVLAPGADLDAGTMSLQPPGDLRVVVAAADGGGVTAPWLGLALPDQERRFGRMPQVLDGGTITVQNMPNGRFELLVWGEDITPTFLPLTTTGNNPALPVAAQRGTPTSFVWGSRGICSLQLSRAGSELVQLMLSADRATFGLEPGSYRVEVECNGARGAAGFTVGASTGEPIVLQLTK